MNVKLAQAVYDHSPVWMQNLLLSGYGLKLYRTRYGRTYRRHLDFLEKTQTWSESELRELQARELRRLLEHAERYVPWYRQLLAERGIAPAEITPDNLSRALPVLEKDEIRRHGYLMLAENTDRKGLHAINTSGTTGSPMTIWADQAALQKNYAFFERFLRMVGVSSRDRSVTFAGRMLIPQSQKAPPYWRRNWAMNTLLCSSYHISDSTAECYLRKIESFKTEFIDSYPSSVYALAQYLAERRGDFDFRLKGIVTSSETLLEHQRALIEKAFGCQVFDQYGSAEMAACVTQCGHGSYHVNLEYGVIEIIREDGRPAASGEAGELVCTGFLNYAMPMIRYRIGDSAVASDRSCTCGLAWPVVESLLGRVDDVILTVDGRRIGRLDPLFKGLTGIKEAQIVQEARDRIVVNLVPDESYTAESGVSLIEALKLRVGPGINVELCFLDRIPRTSSGKFRAVVSKLPATPAGAGLSGEFAADG